MSNNNVKNKSLKKVLSINGNPKRESLCKKLAESYAEGATEAGHYAKIIHISDLDFDKNLRDGYATSIQPLEEDLIFLQKELKMSSHLVIVSPTWWGTVPAKLKGLFDRILLPGFAFKFPNGKYFQDKLLKGKTATIIATMDTPVWYYRFILGDQIIQNLKRSILEFCGIKVNTIFRFGPTISSTDATRKKWIQTTINAGRALK